jgi:hypothetical protein
MKITQFKFNLLFIISYFLSLIKTQLDEPRISYGDNYILNIKNQINQENKLSQMADFNQHYKLIIQEFEAIQESINEMDLTIH